MREPFAHDAVVRMDDGADERAPGAAITVELCGHWDHAPPCPLAPHHTSALRVDGELRLRILFAAEPEAEAEVRRRIDRALAAGRDGGAVRWRLLSSRPGVVSPEEADRARRLTW